MVLLKDFLKVIMKHSKLSSVRKCLKIAMKGLKVVISSLFSPIPVFQFGTNRFAGFCLSVCLSVGAVSQAFMSKLYLL